MTLCCLCGKPIGEKGQAVVGWVTPISIRVAHRECLVLAELEADFQGADENAGPDLPVRPWDGPDRP